jgi:hypothetical protein
MSMNVNDASPGRALVASANRALKVANETAATDGRIMYFADNQGQLFGRLANGTIAPAEIVDGKPVLKSTLPSAAS